MVVTSIDNGDTKDDIVDEYPVTLSLLLLLLDDDVLVQVVLFVC